MEETDDEDEEDEGNVLFILSIKIVLSHFYMGSGALREVCAEEFFICQSFM